MKYKGILYNSGFGGNGVNLETADPQIKEMGMTSIFDETDYMIDDDIVIRVINGESNWDENAFEPCYTVELEGAEWGDEVIVDDEYDFFNEEVFKYLRDVQEYQEPATSVEPEELNIIKIQMQQKLEEEFVILHPETEADLVNVKDIKVDGMTVYEANNAQKILEEMAEDLVAGGSKPLPTNELIWDNDEDVGLEGKLYKYPNGALIIENIEAEYTFIDIFYSELGTSRIQYCRVPSAPLLKEHAEGNKNVGMFYILKVDTPPLFTIEQCTVAFDKVDEDNYTLTVQTQAKDTTESKIKIERIYGGR